MKTITCHSFAAAMIIAAFALVAPCAEAIPTWAESFGLDGRGPDGYYGTGDDFPLGIAAMPDGGVTVVGKLSYPTNSTSHTENLNNDALIRYGADGTILWKKALAGSDGFLSDSGYRFARIVTDSQGNIYLASFFSNVAGSGGPIYDYVAKFNSGGAVLWQRIIGGNTGGANQIVTTQFNSLSLAPNGALVLTSSGAPVTGGHSFPVLTVVDGGSGALLFRRGYDNTSVQYLPALAGSGSMDGTKYLFCTPANGTTVILVNAAGDVLDTKNYFNFSTGLGATASIPTADGDFMVLSGNVIRKIGADQVTIGGVTSTALVTRFERLINYPAMGGHTIVQTADGGYLIGGAITVAPSDLPPNTQGPKAGIYRLNAQGAVTRVFAYGGFATEATYEANTSAGLCSAVPTTDGGFAFATDTTSYRNQTDQNKPDWWVVKTDGSGHIGHFLDVMIDVTARGSSTPYVDDDSRPLGTYAPQAINGFGAGPTLVLSDADGILRIQASPPRISSAPVAEAVVNQHFAYHITTSFFDAGATITYSETGLPQGFDLDPATGVISGLAAPGSETNVPIPITLMATDGTTASSPFILGLTIGDGIPAFTVNGSDQPSSNLADTAIAFAAKYPGTLAGRMLEVQATTTPNSEASWQKLANGTNGYMTYDQSTRQYIVNSTSYPTVNGVYFRATLIARGHSTLPSNVVGPFNLGSAASRAPQTLFRLIRDGLRADFDFRAIALSSPSGTAIRVQHSSTPSDESSWTDLQDGTSGQMIPDGTDPTHRSLVFNSYPAADGIYFRAVSTVPGRVDSLSNLIGPYSIVADVPPVVTVTPPSGNGTGHDFDHPIVIPVDSNGIVTFTISARAVSSRFIKGLSILVDGSTISTVNGGATTASQAYTTSRIGDHVIEAVAVDDLGGTARAGTGPVYIRVVPAVAAARGKNLAVSSSSGGKIYTVATQGGVWTDPATWRDEQGNSGVPGINDFAIIGASSVRFTLDVTVKSVSINGGHLVGPGNLTILGMMTIAEGTVDNYVGLFIEAGAVCELLNSADIRFNASPEGYTGKFYNDGTLNVHGSGGLIGAEQVRNRGTLNWQSPLLQSSLVGNNLSPKGRAIASPDVQNTGRILSNSLAPSLIAPAGGEVVKSLIGQDGGTLIGQDGGTLIGQDGGTLVSENGAGLIANDGGTLITNDGGTHRGPNLHAPTGSSGFTQTGGQTDLNSMQIIGPVTINGGVVTGSGVIWGDLTINGGYLSPGDSTGLIAVTGNYTQGSNGTLIVEAAGGEANQSDQLQIGGSATLGGRLDVRTLNGYVPFPNERFVPVGYSSVNGSFALVSQNVQLTSTPTGPVLTIIPGQPSPQTGQPLNISTRMSVQTGDNVLIAGFIVTGPSGSTKKVIIRGLGPSLAASGISGTLADPLLQLNKPDGSTVTNDNWQEGDPSQIPAGFAPSDPRESVIVATLTPGNYTAKISGAHGETGVGLAEIYDLDIPSPAKLANISTRGFIDTGDNVMIGGFIVGGTEPARILVRATGPTLTQFGVAGALADPTLELHDGNGTSISNDDWRETQESEIIATTIPPRDSREPAILVTLVPGSYTAIVRGKNNTTGIGLVEAYNLQ